MGKPKIHFEQISVETVKKVATRLPAVEFTEGDTAGDDNVSIETEDKDTPADERWRKVAQKVQHEEDPKKMIGLVQELITTFDRECKRLPRMRFPAKQSGDFGEGKI